MFFYMYATLPFDTFVRYGIFHSFLYGGGGIDSSDTNSGDHILNNQVFNVVTIIIVLKCVSLSSGF